VIWLECRRDFLASES